MLDAETTLFFFDYVDPGSYLMSQVLEGAHVDWLGFEVRVPPSPPIDPRDPAWQAYQNDVAAFAQALDVEMVPPHFVPWTRKAHELGAHARQKHCYPEVRRALFRAHFVDRLDIGRIDLLVEIASSAGLDPSETKAALDVDRYTGAVLSDRAMAEEKDVAGVPTLICRSKRLEGLHSPSAIEAWVRDGDF